MGKGGTKFVGEAIGARNQRPSGQSGKELRQQMQRFIETGHHAEIELAEREKNLRRPPVPLPDLDVNRSFVYMDISIGGKPAGRLVIELFDDMVPAAANSFRSRCLPGSAGGLQGTLFHKLLPTYAIFGGKRTIRYESVPQLQSTNNLRHVELGVVSVSLSGDEFAISLGRSLVLDAAYQVVGRVHLGKEIIDSFNAIRILPNDAPREDVAIMQCGATNPQGTHESLAEDGPVEKQVANLKEESKKARCAVMAALQVGLGNKRKADDVKPASTATGGPSCAVRQPEHKVKRMFDSVLGESSDASDSSSSGSDNSEEKQLS